MKRRFALKVACAALAASGLLSKKMHGPSVMPPQPEGLWKSAYSGEKWIAATGEDRYRRGLYTYVKRTAPYPAMTSLDAPSREICSIRRLNTNTPLQALVTLNDEAFVEMAQSLARKMYESGKTPEERITFGMQRALLRPVQAEEVAVLPAFSVEAVDGTGAGDAFTGFLLAELLGGATFKDALLGASAAGAITAARLGAAPAIPHAAEVRQFLRERW